MVYLLAMKEGVAESRDLQVLLVGAENTGKTCLISSFLGEEFVEGQAATEAVEVDVCKIYCKNWTRIRYSDKTNLLQHQFFDQPRGKVAKGTMPLKATDNVVPSGRLPVTKSGGVISSLPMTASPTSTRVLSNNLVKSHPQTSQKVSSDTSQYHPASLNLAL